MSKLTRCETSYGAQIGECAVWLSADTLCSRPLGHPLPHRGCDPSGFTRRWIDYDDDGHEIARGGGW